VLQKEENGAGVLKSNPFFKIHFVAAVQLHGLRHMSLNNDCDFAAQQQHPSFPSYP